MAKQSQAKSRAAAKSKSKRSTPAQAPLSKLDAIIKALRSPKGATICDLMELTGWQSHSVRGALAGSLKKNRGLTITSTKTGAERIYRIEARK